MCHASASVLRRRGGGVGTAQLQPADSQGAGGSVPSPLPRQSLEEILLLGWWIAIAILKTKYLKFKMLIKNSYKSIEI